MDIPDARHIANGLRIPTSTYADQPYIVITDDGAWLCCITTGAGVEGAAGQHVVTMRSPDRGHTWSAPVNVEPPDGPEASYAVMLKSNTGRIYCFYNHNTDNVRSVKCDPTLSPDGQCRRVDSLGHYVFKYSDDHGRSWSARRYDVPVRAMAIDRANADGGKLRYFWNVGRPFTYDGVAYMSLHKVGGFGSGFFSSSEGVLIASDNILTETDPEKLHWETLPDGDYGLRTPPGGGPVSEEHSYCVLSDGSFFSVYRSIDGYPVCAYSRDRGHTWSTPEYLSYADGRRVKHPRAANFAWKLRNGSYLYWFHNHGGRFVAERARAGDGGFPYEDRNPAWLLAGREIDSPEGKRIAWSQPEIALYDDDTYIRMSYPDLVEDGGKIFLTETQKSVARVHELPAELLTALEADEQCAGMAAEGLLLDIAAPLPESIAMPELPAFTARDHNRSDHGGKCLRTGFTLDMRVTFDDLAPHQVLLDSRTPAGNGLAVVTSPAGTVQIILNDGRSECRWSCDPGLLSPGRAHHIGIVVDAGPGIISFVIDGRFNDGGEARQFGWGRFSRHLRHAQGRESLAVAPDLHGQLHRLRLYGRARYTAELIASHRAQA